MTKEQKVKKEIIIRVANLFCEYEQKNDLIEMFNKTLDIQVIIHNLGQKIGILSVLSNLLEKGDEELFNDIPGRKHLISKIISGDFINIYLKIHREVLDNYDNKEKLHQFIKRMESSK